MNKVSDNKEEGVSGKSFNKKGEKENIESFEIRITAKFEMLDEN